MIFTDRRSGVSYIAKGLPDAIDPNAYDVIRRIVFFRRLPNTYLRPHQSGVTMRHIGNSSQKVFHCGIVMYDTSKRGHYRVDVRYLPEPRELYRRTKVWLRRCERVWSRTVPPIPDDLEDILSRFCLELNSSQRDTSKERLLRSDVADYWAYRLATETNPFVLVQKERFGRIRVYPFSFQPTAITADNRLIEDYLNDRIMPHYPPTPDIPTFLFEIRQALNLSQAQMARLIGGGPNGVGRYERGEITPHPAALNLLRALVKDPKLVNDLLMNNPL